MRILLTGGAGFIGSHTAVEIVQSGHDVVIFDNFSNSDASVLERLERILGRPVTFEEGDIRDYSRMREVLQKHSIDAVVHFAGLKAVGESVEKPLEYYDNNITGKLKGLRARDRSLYAMQEINAVVVAFKLRVFILKPQVHPLGATDANKDSVITTGKQII